MFFFLLVIQAVVLFLLSYTLLLKQNSLSSFPSIDEHIFHIFTVQSANVSFLGYICAILLLANEFIESRFMVYVNVHFSCLCLC